jgi:hypothetical protein
VGLATVAGVAMVSLCRGDGVAGAEAANNSIR